MHSLKSCLVLVHTRPSAALLLRRFAVEASQLVGVVKIVNTVAYDAMVQGKMNAPLTSSVKTDAAFYESLTVSLISHHMSCGILSGECSCAVRGS